MRVSFAAKAVLSDLPLKQGKGGAAARGEHGQQWQNFAHAGGPGEGLRKMEGELHMDMKNPYSPAITHFAGQLPDCPNTNSQVPVSQEHTEALTAVADRAMKLLENFPREENRLWALLSVEHGWQSCSNDDEDKTQSATRTLWCRQSTMFRAFFFCREVFESMSVLLSLHTCEGHQKVKTSTNCTVLVLLYCVSPSVLPNVM